MPSRDATLVRLLGSGRPGTLPYVILGVTLAATAVVSSVLHRTARERDRANFMSAAHSAEDRIVRRIDTYLAVLGASRGLFHASDVVTRADFAVFVEQLRLQERYPGIQGVGFSRRLRPGDREGLEAQLRSELGGDVRVWPGPEPYTSVVFLEPLDRRNRAAIGFDMFSEAARRAAMTRARDTGLPAASGLVTLVQEIDAEKQAGFLIYLPFYGRGLSPDTIADRQERLEGLVYSAFRVGDLFEGIFGSEGDAPRLGFVVEDALDGKLLYRSAEPTEAPRFSITSSITVAGRPWRLTFESLPAFEATAGVMVWPSAFAAGALLSLLMFLLTRTQTRAQEQRRVHSLILESMREGVSVSDEAGIIRYTNPAEDEIFGYRRGELIGKHVTVQNTYGPAENARIVGEVIGQLKAGGEWIGEFSNVKKDGTPFTTAARITAIEIGGRPHWLCVQADVTEKRQTELERSRLLERESSLRVEAESASRAKDEFLAMLGHELRNPLAPIVTALHVLRRRAPAAVSREHEVIERQVRHLQRLVDDLLDVSRIARGKMKLERQRVDLVSAVRLAVEMVSPLLEEKKHRLVLQLPPTGMVVEGDEGRLAQSVANLLSNAAKYTPAGGLIEVRGEREGDRLCLRVRDNGIGIGPELMPRLFELFTQGARGLDRSQGGLGIGLSLAKSFVEAHGGTLEPHSDGPDRGSEFVIRLPPASGLGNADTPEATPLVPPPVAAPGRRVMVVDDNQDAADLLAEVLEELGYQALVAYDPVRALELAAEQRPEVAILDIGLPVMDGYELAQRLSTEGRPYLIALTGYGQEHDRARTRAAGFDLHLVKPVAIDELTAKLAEHFAAR